MKPTKIIIEYGNGVTWSTENDSEIRSIGLNLPKNIAWRISSDTESLRNLYFLMITELAKNTKSGNNKTEMHNALKPMLFGSFKDFPHYFIEGVYKPSTKALTHQGWLALIEQLKVEANNIFNYVFK